MSEFKPDEIKTEWAWECGEESACLHVGDEDWVRGTAPHLWPAGRVVTRQVAKTPWRDPAPARYDQKPS